VTFLALKAPSERTSIREITRRLRIPAHFLAKILQDLTRKNLLVSLKGPTGGFALAKPPEAIRLIDIVKAIDGNDLFEKCAMGFPECSTSNPCAFHEEWAELREGLERLLASKSVLEIARKMGKPEYRR